RPSARSLASITTQLRSRSPLSREMLRVCSVSFKFVPLKSQILAGPMGFEPTTSDVTGRRSNRAELRPRPNHLLLHFPARVATTRRGSLQCRTEFIPSARSQKRNKYRIDE